MHHVTTSSIPRPDQSSSSRHGGWKASEGRFVDDDDVTSPNSARARTASDRGGTAIPTQLIARDLHTSASIQPTHPRPKWQDGWGAASVIGSISSRRSVWMSSESQVSCLSDPDKPIPALPTIHQTDIAIVLALEIAIFTELTPLSR
jgi:hypothetical protein